MASKGGPTRKDTYTVSVLLHHTVNGASTTTDLGVWDGLTGGDLDSDEAKYWPGGMAPQVSLGGHRNPSNIVLKRLYRLQRDHDRLNLLLHNVGRGTVEIHKLPMDIDGNTYGKPLNYSGKLKRVTPPEHDSTSSDPGIIEMEVTPDGDPVVG
jgi:hypothetical protein